MLSISEIFSYICARSVALLTLLSNKRMEKIMVAVNVIVTATSIREVAMPMEIFLFIFLLPYLESVPANAGRRFVSGLSEGAKMPSGTEAARHFSLKPLTYQR